MELQVVLCSSGALRVDHVVVGMLFQLKACINQATSMWLEVDVVVVEEWDFYTERLTHDKSYVKTDAPNG